MKEIFIADKQEYLNQNYPFGNPLNLEDEIVCIHCNNIFKVGKYKVFLQDGEEYICCPDTPKCNGTVIDWIHLG